jgi:hypothetical protein
MADRLVSMTTAARRLGVSHPTVARNRLEAEGVPLQPGGGGQVYVLDSHLTLLLRADQLARQLQRAGISP